MPQLPTPPSDLPLDLPLDLIGIAEATDKSSLAGDYLRHYARIFAPLRHTAFTLIEIGVLNGSSVRTWERYFTQARIVGVDIDPRCRACASDRIAIEIGSQNDPEFLHRLASAYAPLVVIDDGSHRSDDIIFTFERLFPALPPGGLYAIEDLHFHLQPQTAGRLQGESPIAAHDYVTALARDHLGDDLYRRGLPTLRQYLLAAIGCVEFIGQAAVFRKRDQSDPLQELRRMQPCLRAANDWLNWTRYGERLLRAGGSLAEAAEAHRQAIAANPKAVIPYERLSEALEGMGDIQGALTNLESARALADRPDLVEALNQRIARLRSVKSDPLP